MSGIKHPMTFLSGFFHENIKKSSIPKCQELSIRCHSYLDFPWKCQKKLHTQMSRIKHPMSVLFGFSMKTSKKARYPNVRNQASDDIFIWIFPWQWQKKLDTEMSWIKPLMSFISGFSMQMSKKHSIPKCQKLSILCQFYMVFSMKTSKKARYPHVRN